ncbi:hypothetical protein [Chryseobacterium sp. JUb7]|uniref:hypothetical protein n=1 Tax=Chryseobacterium sp. JUb7 TaxID=2940599 RepID=UPI00216885B9|nr:hypothetical protein [Chryseobacterium sp. JUb7]MCS3531880.1 hypothetical protein [Chryseobacterium sp. JUb7]
MKKTIIISKWLLMLICLCIIHTQVNAQYTSTYNNVTYQSTQPYNLNVIYFVPNDVPLDPTYKVRLSTQLFWAQNFYRQNMIANGFGPKTFGLFTEATNPTNVKIILIHGTKSASSYPYNNTGNNVLQEVNTFFNSNPNQKTSARSLIFTAGKNAYADVAFYGLGLNCFAIDYPGFDVQYLSSTGTGADKFRSLFGGMLHELGHGLGLPHSHQTNTENTTPTKGMNLMFYENGTLGVSPTFINRAGCAILNNSELFATTSGTVYRNGNTTNLKNIKTSFSNGSLNVSGTFESNRTVNEVNIYQDSYATPSQGYYKVAWSVKPVGNSFSIAMPVNELQTKSGPYNLQIELVLNNEENSFQYFPFNYNNGIPDIEKSTFVGGSLSLTTDLTGKSYQWQYKTSSGSWQNFTEGTSPGYANFTGTKTNTLNISNVSSIYVNNPDTARVVVTLANGLTEALSEILKYGTYMEV